MKLSMWILADALGKYSPEVRITGGGRLLRNVRFGARGESEETVYVSSASGGGSICSSGSDALFIRDGEPAAVLNEVMDIFERYGAWEAHTEEMIREGCGADALASQFGQILDITLLLADTTFYSYARHFARGEDRRRETEATAPARLPDLGLMLAINRQPSIRTWRGGPYYVKVPGAERIRTVARNLFLEDRHIGWLVAFKRRDKLSPGEMQLVDLFGELTERYHRSNSAGAPDLERTSLFTDIIEGKPARTEEAENRLGLFGLGRDDDKLVYVMRCGCEESHAVFGSAGPMGEEATLRFWYQGLLVLLVNVSARPESAVDASLLELMDKMEMRIGKSRVFRNIFDLKGQVETARIAMEYSSGGIGTAETAAVPYCCRLIEENSGMEVIHPALKTLEEYDGRHGSSLVKTLHLFLAAERNYMKTAQALHLHRSSLIYRIQRISELTGVDLEDADVRFHLLLSCRLLGLTPESGCPPVRRAFP